jgi:hypothetical protein
MEQDPGYQPIPPVSPPPMPVQLPQEPKKNNSWLIIIGIVLVVLCCCCLGAAALLWQYGDLIVNNLNR